MKDVCDDLKKVVYAMQSVVFLDLVWSPESVKACMNLSSTLCGGGSSAEMV